MKSKKTTLNYNKLYRISGGAAMMGSRRRNRTSISNSRRYHDLRSKNTDICFNYCLPLACYIPAYALSQNPDCPTYVPICTTLAASGWLYNSCLR